MKRTNDAGDDAADPGQGAAPEAGASGAAGSRGKASRPRAPRAASNGHAGKNGATARHSHGLTLAKHLDALRLADLKEVAAFWLEGPAAEGTKRQQVERLSLAFRDEGVVYRRLRSLAEKAVDVLLLLLGREDCAADLPGLFQRLPHQEPVRLQFHEAEAGLKTLARRGFVGAQAQRGGGADGRIVYVVPQELAAILGTLLREETRPLAAVFSLSQHLRALPVKARRALEPLGVRVADHPEDGEAESILAAGGAPALIAALPAGPRTFVEHALDHFEGVLRRGRWTRREEHLDLRWDARALSAALEEAAVGTVARLSLGRYGLACDDEVLVVFREVLEDLHRRRDSEPHGGDTVLRAGCDLVADLGAYIEHLRRHPVRVGRDGDVYKSAAKRIQSIFVFRESSLAGPAEIHGEVHSLADHLGLLKVDEEGFLEPKPEADLFLNKALDDKVGAMLRIAREQPGPRGRSLHQHELRGLVETVLAEEPERWWRGRSLAAVCRHRYLETLDARGIAARHRDRFFTAYFSGREAFGELLEELERHWLRRLYRMGMLDAAMRDDRPVAWRLSTLGARVLGIPLPALDTGLKPVLVNPDFEILVLPEGDVSDVVHALDGFAQRVRTEDVVHFRLTRPSFEAGVAAGRDPRAFLAFLEARARGGLPQNVRYSLESWAGAIAFATLEPGVLISVENPEALARLLETPGMDALLLRRVGPTEALLKSSPTTDRRLVQALRERHIEIRE